MNRIVICLLGGRATCWSRAAPGLPRPKAIRTLVLLRPLSWTFTGIQFTPGNLLPATNYPARKSTPPETASFSFQQGHLPSPWCWLRDQTDRHRPRCSRRAGGHGRNGTVVSAAKPITARTVHCHGHPESDRAGRQPSPLPEPQFGPLLNACGAC